MSGQKRSKSGGPKGGGGRRGPAHKGGKGGRNASGNNRIRAKGQQRGSGQRGTTPVRRDDRSRAVGTGQNGRPSGPGGDQIEGRQAVRELLLAGTRKTREIIMASDLDPAPILDEIIDLADEAKVEIRQISRSKFENKTLTTAPQGVLAYAAPLPDHHLEDLVNDSAETPFLLVVDGITDPGNLGAMLRTAECAGVTGIIMPRHRAARISPTVAKTAAGAIEHLPMATVTSIPKALASLADLGVWSVGLDMVADQEIYDLDVAAGPVALVMGAEGKGLSRLARQKCDIVATIPLLGTLGSLNVSAAAAVACYEVVRARRGLEPTA